MTESEQLREIIIEQAHVLEDANMAGLMTTCVEAVYKQAKLDAELTAENEKAEALKFCEQQVRRWENTDADAFRHQHGQRAVPTPSSPPATT